MTHAFHYADIPILLRQNSRYPLHKFALLRNAVVREGLFLPGAVISGEPAAESILSLTHTTEYISQVKNNGLSEQELREMGFQWSENLHRRGSAIVGSTLGNAKAALSSGISFTLGGGSHHAFSNRGRGYCIYNDTSCVTNYLLSAGAVRTVSIFDCDVHQGDGTAEILSTEPRAFTCSIHGAKNYPFRKERSSLDLDLEDNCGDERYLEAVTTGLAACLEQRPDLLFYVAGADPFEEDRLGRLKISSGALAQRDKLVFEQCRRLEIPVSVVFGGGYCEPIEKTVALNLQTIEIATSLFQ